MLSGEAFRSVLQSPSFCLEGECFDNSIAFDLLAW
jgi:hypothetical protein